MQFDIIDSSLSKELFIEKKIIEERERQESTEFILGT